MDTHAHMWTPIDYFYYYYFFLTTVRATYAVRKTGKRKLAIRSDIRGCTYVQISSHARRKPQRYRMPSRALHFVSRMWSAAFLELLNLTLQPGHVEGAAETSSNAISGVCVRCEHLW